MPGLVAQARRHRRKSLFLPFIRRTRLRTHTVQRSTAIGWEDRLLRHARRERGKSGAWRNAYLPIVVLKVVPSRRAEGASKKRDAAECLPSERRTKSRSKSSRRRRSKNRVWHNAFLPRLALKLFQTHRSPFPVPHFLNTANKNILVQHKIYKPHIGEA